jgi:hypothetical protein
MHATDSAEIWFHPIESIQIAMKLGQEVPKKQDSHIHWWIDGVSLPVIILLAVVLRKWLPGPVAYSVSLVLVMASYSLFKSDRISVKRYIVLMLLTALLGYVIATLIKF